MTKELKLGALSIAASAMLATSVFAGTAGYIKIKKHNLNGARATAGDYNTTYTQADALALGSTPIKVAHELMQSTTLDLGADDLVYADGNESTIMYIPTTDIPGGTRLNFTLAGAEFNVSSGSMYLLKSNSPDNNNSFASVGSSDGLTTGVSTVKFLTQSGITIQAGTPLVLSTLSSSDKAPTIKYAVANCGTPTDVTIAVASAVTDGGTGYSIEGGVAAATMLIDAVQQFAIAMTAVSDTTPTAQVDVQSPALRKKFVVATGTSETATKYTATFTNAESGLDKKVTLGSGDKVKIKFTPDSTPSNVNMKVYNVGGTQIDANTTINGTTVNLLASAAFVGASHAVDFNVTRIADATMSYNYKVTTNAYVDFNTTTYNDTCPVDKLTHNVGINGAVLKAPYMWQSQTDAASNSFVRITNEDTASAEIYADVFDEATGTTGTAGNKVPNVNLGKVGANSSRTIFAQEIIDAAGSANLSNLTTGASAGRFSSVFVVTSPKEKVYGTSVLKMGDKDRVMPIKDNSTFGQ